MASLYFADQHAKKAREVAIKLSNSEVSEAPVTSTARQSQGQGQAILDTDSLTSGSIEPMSIVGPNGDGLLSSCVSGNTNEDDDWPENPSAKIGDNTSVASKTGRESTTNNDKGANETKVESGVHDPEEGSRERADDISAPVLIKSQYLKPFSDGHDPEEKPDDSSAPFFVVPLDVEAVGDEHVPEQKPTDGSKRRSHLALLIAVFIIGLIIIGVVLGALLGVELCKCCQSNKAGASPSSVGRDESRATDVVSSPTQIPVVPIETMTPRPTLISTSPEPTTAPTPFLRATSAPTPLSSELNDACSQAITAYVGGRYEGSTGFAHSDLDGFTGCLLNQLDGPGVWYQIVGAGVPITASTCNGNTDFDTKLFVLRGSCEGNSFSCEAANDDSTDGLCGSHTRITWFGMEGTLYYVLLSGYAGSTGNYELSFDSVPVLNDSCNDATNLSTTQPIQTFPGSTSFAAFDVVEECRDSNTNTTVATSGVWYRMDAVSDGMWTVSTCLETSFDSRLVVFEGDCDNLVCVTSNDDGCGVGSTGSSIDLSATAGTSYYVFVYGYLGSTGSFTLEVVGQQ